MTAIRSALAPADEAARIAAFAGAFTLEATRPSAADIAALAVLERGTRIYLSAVPNRPAEESVAAAVRVRAAGMDPVPHVAVRNFPSHAAVDDFLARLNGEAAVDKVLVIAGDRAESGPLRSAHDVIATGALQRRGIRTIGIAGYPHGHPAIGDEALTRALADKIAAAEAGGLAVEIVTQFCFEAGPILDFIAKVRSSGFGHPVRIGLAGPTSFTALMRYAARCGVRTSAQAMARRSGLMRQMFAMSTPDDIVRSLAQAAPAAVALHYFSFGGIPAAARWARAVADGRFALDADGGFRAEA